MYQPDQTVTMKKQHPCGGKAWKIVSIGAEVKLQCLTCGRFITLSKTELSKRAKEQKN